MKYLFTSESVTEGHPDKIADQISDSILDDILKNDPKARVACEVMCAKGLVLISGEISSNYRPDYDSIARNTIKEIGYTRSKYGFDSENVAILESLSVQSPDIALGVDEAEKKEQGAGDQGLMFGYATNQTEEYMPLPIVLSHKLARRLAFVRKNNILDYLRPDGKTQVTVEYENNIPKRIDTIVISTQHHPEVSLEQIKKDIIKEVVNYVVSSDLLDENTKYFINPTGRFVIGGPKGDVGLTGRKIIVDTYGGYARHGGGAFSGKDPSKVDRSACYAARWVAKNLVASKVCDECEIQVSYAIGISKPVSIKVDTFNTNKYPNELIEKAVLELFDLTPSGIIKALDLLKPIYKDVSAYGHFGRDDLDLPWEKLNKVEEILEFINKFSK